MIEWLTLAICIYMIGFPFAGMAHEFFWGGTGVEQTRTAARWPLVLIGLVALAPFRARQRARAQDVATLERAEAWLIATDGEPPPLPPAIPLSMRDPAFQFRQARLDEFDACIKAWETCRGQSYEYMKTLCRGASDAKCRRDELLAQPLIADRRFTLLTHCQHGHVATHWLGRITTDHVERICRFERCAATWLERT